MINFRLIGQRIKNLRREKDYTQENFSEMLGISTEHLSRIETGSCRPSLNLIENISSLLGISEQNLMFGDEKTNQNNIKIAEKISCLSPEKQQALSMIIDLLI